ncbi:hypothetical protein MKW94_010563 [Papaver nudicaule]|uniref:LRAT domain-containing protein n=1 Tax=Papaver nudicaule TaxID=74823 RepID=A0AA41SFR1_PAPNU|nr:hypothetical protein [Papaver nudicaule]
MGVYASHIWSNLLLQTLSRSSYAVSTNLSAVSVVTATFLFGLVAVSQGVVLSCLDCFLGSGSLYLFEYGVTPSIFFAKVRGGTCTTAQSDPKDMVIHRAMYLLQKGFGNYDIFLNNCEDFALYCKTGLLTLDKAGVGRSGQAASVVGAPLAAILATPLRFFMPAPVGMAVTAGMYCVSRYATDIGVRSVCCRVGFPSS